MGGVLELGPAHGIMTDILYREFQDYTVVDASTDFIKSIKDRHPNIEAVVSLFEEYNPVRKYKFITLGHVLEHVDDPVQIIEKCKGWLEPDGIVLAAVPNANSLHRQVGVMMGMISNVKELNKGDIKIGHRRVYDKDMLIRDFNKGGMKIIKSGGYWLKPMDNAHIEKNWSEKLIYCYMKMGEKYPEIACNIYVVAG